jgi:hypothetical protein
LSALSASQNVDIVDAAAAARGEPGLAGKAGWRAGKTAPAASAPAPKLARVPGLPIGWLALVLGAGLLWIQRRLWRTPVRIS